MTVEEETPAIQNLHLSEPDASHSEEDAEDLAAENEAQENDAVTRGFPEGVVVLPDESPEQFDADDDLTSAYADDVEYIDLIHLKVKSFEALGLGRFQQLKGLCLRSNLLDSIAGVKVLNEELLEDLDVYDNRINHISKHINALTKLTSLDFSFNKIKNIKNIDKLVNLESLYFVQNRISEITGLATLKRLRMLELGGNRIEVISDTLLQLPALEELWLGKNRIKKLENLGALKNLRILSIQSNRLTKIEGLEELENLEELYLSHNGISKIENLEKNTKLKTIDITSNRISDLDGLSHLTKLTDLWCSYNQIADFGRLESLAKLPELETVYFEGNPIQLQNPPAYRRKVRLNLGPGIKKIDATYVTGNL
ncbi:unnamed protein product [Kuraishia capsulata CBS 1993]|uniref:Protein phosphatase 1 regulatory subunit 7 n=1 Tax=Kuraishia capsulata CBS 1993 TaxID=1382522 RepID=W6MQA1_9ASCO|nr:uncharacterized protein KUCA_T00004856001 [Kuraishia capsulata CBS 1993]CDK28871.1 unnamed protein product [Kuraishia capsulata CBS 1993]